MVTGDGVVDPDPVGWGGPVGVEGGVEGGGGGGGGVSRDAGGGQGRVQFPHAPLLSSTTSLSL